MKKKLLCLNLIICTLFLISIFSIHVFAEDINTQNWMSQIVDDTSIAELSIPGTHESAATKGIKIPIWGKDYGKCQYGPYQTVIIDQLNMGVRFLDIRCRYLDKNTFSIHHGNIYQNLMFGDVLNSCANFLHSNPSETVFMRVKQEFSSVSDSEFKTALSSYVNRNSNLFWRSSQDQDFKLKLGNFRGKVVILYDSDIYIDSKDIGLTYGLFSKQDYYNTSSYDEKWRYFVNALQSNYSTPHINYLSAQGDWKCTPEDLAHNLNPKLKNILSNFQGKTGIIATDFMDKELSEKIIKCNNFGETSSSDLNYLGNVVPSLVIHIDE